MKSKEIRAMGLPELKEKMSELYKELMKDNAQVATGTVPKNPDKLRRAKKTIAQMKTIMHERATQKISARNKEAGQASLAKSQMKKEFVKKA